MPSVDYPTAWALTGLYAIWVAWNWNRIWETVFTLAGTGPELGPELGWEQVWDEMQRVQEKKQYLLIPEGPDYIDDPNKDFYAGLRRATFEEVESWFQEMGDFCRPSTRVTSGAYKYISRVEYYRAEEGIYYRDEESGRVYIDTNGIMTWYPGLI